MHMIFWTECLKITAPSLHMTRATCHLNNLKNINVLIWSYVFLGSDLSSSFLSLSFSPPPHKIHTAEPGYKDIGLYDTSAITLDILWRQLIPHC
jgi:hypothetical protein